MSIISYSMLYRQSAFVLTCSAAAGFSCAIAGSDAYAQGSAQNYPLRPIRLIVPLAPGGGADLAARILAIKLSERYSQQVVVDNRAGGGGNIGAEIVARAPADGYTLVMGTSSTFAVNPTLYRNLSYDAVRDFAPVSFISFSPNILVVHPGTPANSIKDLIALAKSRPGQLTYASSGIGGSAHLAAELFKLVAGIDIVHVPYKGTGQALPDVIGGQVQMIFGSGPAVLPHMSRLRVLAVAGPRRIPALPEVPTMAEAGLPGVESTAWNGVLAPAATPRDIIVKLNAEIVRIFSLAEVKKQLADLGSEVATGTPAEFGSYIKGEIVKWSKVVKAAGIRVE